MKNLFEWPNVKPNVPQNGHHWCHETNAATLQQMITHINPKFILELGSWTGAGSTTLIANNAPNAQIVCVDHWSKDLNDFVQDEFGLEQLKEFESQIEVLWETFLVNMWEHKHHVTPLRATTKEGLKTLSTLNIPFDMIYIDAHHDYTPVKLDIEMCHKNWPNAIIIGDDYSWKTVSKAVHDYADENNLKVETHGNCWWYLTN
jgi:predicted O-methyltransferase YrrM